MARLAIYGVGSIAEQVYQYNLRYHLYDIQVFINDNASENESFHGLPVMCFDKFKENYSFNDVSVLVTIGYTKCNTIRQRVCLKVEEAGFRLSNFISPGANCWPASVIGHNVIVFDDVFIGTGAHVMDNVIIYEGAKIAHNVTLKENVLLSLGVVIGGNAEIGVNTFIGLNATIKSSAVVGAYNIIASGANVIKSSMAHSVIKGNPGVAEQKDTLQVKI